MVLTIRDYEKLPALRIIPSDYEKICGIMNNFPAL